MPVGAPKRFEKREVSKAMSSKLPWIAAIIVLAAAAAAWALWPTAEVPATVPSAGARITLAAGSGTVFAAPPENSGIENIYIVKAGQNYNENFSGLTDNYLAVISSNGSYVTIPYDTPFAIVVAVTGHKDNMGKLDKAYLKVALGATTDSNSWSITWDNSNDTNEYIFYSDATKIRVNVVWDNSGSYYQLQADDNLNIQHVDLWIRGK
ncbi:MAG: hypothetical protein ACP5PX_02465 [Candidatus Hadarchaeum sp.]|uniref:hypothetical protein n=1 Tax=Candidatus Hadarchaeum sp. TaxID=2883567 RepID=UPI003D13A931